jgi:hypothetical protein
MSTTQKPKRPPPPLTARQTASLEIAKAMVSAAGYEILDQGNGEIAANIARRAAQVADAVIAEAA